ncbi:hypothetical protein JCM8547_000467 [Rhodosporidiobolus lusitaniae]
MSDAMKPLPLTLIVAATPSNAIGRASSLPWRLSNEMAYFARMTKGEPPNKEGVNVVIMGRKSWEGIPKKFRPLPGRRNVVVSRQEGFELGDAPNTFLASSLSSAVEALGSPPSTSSSTPATPLNRAFLIGGAQLYNLALTSPPPSSSCSSSSSSYTANRILLTRLLTEYPDCDTFLHDFTSDLNEETGEKLWRRASHEELREWAEWEVPEGVQREKDRMVKEEEKMVEYEYQMWVR